MKKFIVMATLGVAGLVSANTSEKEVKAESKLIYHPITLTSSCGYTQIVNVGPNDQIDCYLTDLQQMEDECSATFENPMMAGYWP
ncbi:hypothetical protein ASG22_08890 [Chryseobacterium sp. Leaf405]|uniref:hypothetical protein n=1 Tax=Chryseobacterium sp. Leaf405 TaxID=1736367 RepID=UPI0006F701D2|nr:hypothetical protein [Chryseobacterium sp. Leaf405]KQT24122.1 hypothetical protein ASG22_08890 [Chryseobacterium sp. Leaf405]